MAHGEGRSGQLGVCGVGELPRGEQPVELGRADGRSPCEELDAASLPPLLRVLKSRGGGCRLAQCGETRASAPPAPRSLRRRRRLAASRSRSTTWRVQ